MVPWPLARFGAAAQLLGRPSEQWLPVTAGLGPELLAETRVVIGADLETIGLTTQLDAADPAAVPPLEELARVDAVTLFVQQVRMSVPDFALTHENAETVAAITTLLQTQQ